MSAEEGNGLSLEGLAHRLETQAQKLETLERENSELRSKVATLEGSQMPPGDDEKPAPALLDGRVRAQWTTWERRRCSLKEGALLLTKTFRGKILNPPRYTAAPHSHRSLLDWHLHKGFAGKGDVVYM